MDLLKIRIRTEGQNLGRGILKVDSFINHQVDPVLMQAVGKKLASYFADMPITKVLTAEISGIAPALMVAFELKVPVVYARKTKPITMPEKVFIQTAPSHTKSRNIELMVSPEFLNSQDKVLIVDDFLATGNTITALIQIVEQAGAEVVGVGAVIEKQFEGGRASLEAMGLRVCSAVIIKEMTDTEIIFAENE
jgi:xanthine phosphoribosyltransferase